MTVEIISRSPIIKPEDITMDDLKSLSKDNFALWALTSGCVVDGNEFEFDSHRYLLPLYLDPANDAYDGTITLIKSAQMGASTFLMLKALWWLWKHQGRKGALYLPNKELVDNMSKDRLAPLMRSIPPIAECMDDSDKLGLKNIGKSSFYMFHLGGVSSRDSVPLDLVLFDEVRLCSPKDIDQTLERISHSPFKNKTFMSTAGLPNSTIDYRFKDGTQHVWRSACGCGPDGCDLARTFPDCIVADDPRRPNDVYLRCPKCRWEIKDAQNGRYVPMNPGADHHSYQVSQLASKFISPKEIWRFYKRTTNMSEFFNSKLGLPYVDEEARGVSLDQLKACVDPMFEWGRPKAKNQPRTAMGVDQGGGYVMAVIADMVDGKKRIRHVEIIDHRNPIYKEGGQKVSPFKRLAQLMEEFNVGLCVVDSMPNINDALHFAQAFPGRVFLAYYNKEAKDMVQWGDKKKHKETVRKAGPLLKFKYIVSINKFSGLDFTLGEWARGDWKCPDPEKLVQMCHDERTDNLQLEAPCNRMFDHFTRMIKRFKETNEETGEGKYEWIYSSGDPHLLFAQMHLTVALERLRRQTIFAFA